MSKGVKSFTGLAPDVLSPGLKLLDHEVCSLNSCTANSFEMQIYVTELKWTGPIACLMSVLRLLVDKGQGLRSGILSAAVSFLHSAVTLVDRIVQMRDGQAGALTL